MISNPTTDLRHILATGLVASLWLTASGCTEEEKGTCAAVEDEASGQWVIAHCPVPLISTSISHFRLPVRSGYLLEFS
jgi:hypothetical protein